MAFAQGYHSRVLSSNFAKDATYKRRVGQLTKTVWLSARNFEHVLFYRMSKEVTALPRKRHAQPTELNGRAGASLKSLTYCRHEVSPEVAACRSA